MGKLIYEGSVRIDIEDRTLAHLQLVISTKLRRGESFHFSWRQDVGIGDGRTSIWLHAEASLIYQYYDARPPTLNAAWLEALSYTAGSDAGLYVVPEPAERTGHDMAPLE